MLLEEENLYKNFQELAYKYNLQGVNPLILSIILIQVFNTKGIFSELKEGLLIKDRQFSHKHYYVKTFKRNYDPTYDIINRSIKKSFEVKEEDKLVHYGFSTYESYVFDSYYQYGWRNFYRTIIKNDKDLRKFTGKVLQISRWWACF